VMATDHHEFDRFMTIFNKMSRSSIYDLHDKSLDRHIYCSVIVFNQFIQIYCSGGKLFNASHLSMKARI
jgi:hypothetical protein